MALYRQLGVAFELETLVRTLSDTSMVVDNAELKECERTVQMMKQKSAKDAKKAAKEATTCAKALEKAVSAANKAMELAAELSASR